MVQKQNQQHFVYDWGHWHDSSARPWDTGCAWRNNEARPFIDISTLYFLQCFDTVGLVRRNQSSAVAEMGDSLVKIGMGRKVGAAVTLFVGGRELGPHLTQCCLGWGLCPYQLASWFIQPFRHSRHGQKSGGCCALSGRGASNTMWLRGWCLPPYEVASWSIQQFGHNTPTSQTGQTTVR